MESIYNNDDLLNVLKMGQLAVIPTDTVYGIVASASNPKAVEKIYKAKDRPANKQPVTLIGSTKQLSELGISLYSDEVYKQYWPGPVSIVHPNDSAELKYLHRGNNEMAFRLPNNGALVEFLLKTGPLASSSANTAGNPPATTIDQAKEYFGDNVAFYLDAGELEDKSSTIVDPRSNQDTIIRK